MLNFIDFEVFKYDWLCVIDNPEQEKRTVIVNSRTELMDYYNSHKSEIFVGYNIRGYDQWIMKCILADYNPYEMSSFIIRDGKNGAMFSSLLEKFPLIIYEAGDMFKSLKQLEAYMGVSIIETSVPFDIPRKLTEQEIEKEIGYCSNDVEQLMEVFVRQKADFDAHLSLIKTFNLPIDNLGKTRAQLSAIILDCRKKYRDDEWDIQIIDTLRIDKYKEVVEWFKNRDNHDYTKNLQIDVCGVPHSFGWGGLHGCPEEPIHEKGLLIHVDVNSFYPSIMIQYDLLSRNSRHPEKYKEIYEKRLQLKKEGKKKEQAPFKIVLNATYGITKDKMSTAYDPRQANNVCINGQLLLLDLLEHLEGYCKVIQSNTDGLIIKINDTDEDFQKVDDICYEWESRTRMGLGFDTISEIWQKDVNNYIFKFEAGGFERKGAYVKELSDLDNDLPIINKALFRYMTENIPVEETINKCDELLQFQKVVKISSKYLYGMHNGEKLTDKTYRVFASTDKNDTAVYKVKNLEKNPEKFANTPDHAFIVNGNINNKKVDSRLDRNYYIKVATERLEQFGISKQFKFDF